VGVALALGFGWGLRGRVGSTGVQPLLLAVALLAFFPSVERLMTETKKTAITSVITVFVYGLSNQGINTSIEPSAVMLT
jgi:hypothetical protein